MTAAATQAGAASGDLLDWHAIDWRKVNAVVRRLQARIVKAVQAGLHPQVHRRELGVSRPRPSRGVGEA